MSAHVIAPHDPVAGVDVTVTRCGWWAFEGFGRPFEGWYCVGSWRSVGRALTRRAALRNAEAGWRRAHAAPVGVALHDAQAGEPVAVAVGGVAYAGCPVVADPYMPSEQVALVGPPMWWIKVGGREAHVPLLEGDTIGRLALRALLDADPELYARLGGGQDVATLVATDAEGRYVGFSALDDPSRLDGMTDVMVQVIGASA